MKRKLMLLLIFCMCFLVGCGGNDDEKGKNTEIQQESEKDTQESIKADLPYGSDIGVGVMYVATPSGTSENGNIPVLLETKDVALDMISINTEEVDGSYWSFIYVDGVLDRKEQLAYSSATVSIQGTALEEGEHIVSIVQYASNEEGGDIITYKEAKYKVVY